MIPHTKLASVASEQLGQGKAQKGKWTIWLERTHRWTGGSHRLALACLRCIVLNVCTTQCPSTIVKRGETSLPCVSATLVKSVHFVFIQDQH